MKLKDLLTTCANDWRYLMMWFDDGDEDNFNINRPDVMDSKEHIDTILKDASDTEIVSKWYFKKDKEGNVDLYVLLHDE